MKNVRKWLSVLLALALVFTLLPQMALPARAEVDQAGWCGESLRWTFDSDTGELTIYGEGNMWNWTSEDPPWQSFLNEVKKVTIESGVTDVGAYAFYRCVKLTSVKIPDSVTGIGNAAFNLCEKLSGITIPYRVTGIGNAAFYKCASLTEITIPGRVTSIGSYAFEDCTKLADITVLNKDCEIYDEEKTLGDPAITTITGHKGSTAETYANKYSYKFEELPTSGQCGDDLTWSFDAGTGEMTVSGTGDMWDFSDAPWHDQKQLIKKVTIENGVTSTGINAFNSCHYLTSVSLPNTLVSIAGSFYHCSSLADVTIPDSVTSIGDFAFWDCPCLTSIMIPAGVTSISGAAFQQCVNLREFKLDSGNTSFCFEDGVLFNSDKTELILCLASKKGKYRVPDGVKTIADFAFEHCEGLTSVTVPDSVTDIGQEAFAYCSRLETIRLPAGLKTIRRCLFYECGRLEDVTIPESVTNIEDFAFFGCTWLYTIVIPNGVTKIGRAAFCGCTALRGVWFPNSLRSIGDTAFSGCIRLDEVVIPKGVTDIGYLVFSHCAELTDVTLPSSLKKIIYGDMFENSSDLTRVTVLNKDCVIPGNSKALGDPATTTICGFKGSTAETYASTYGYKFEEVPISGQCGDDLTWTLDLATGELTITGTGKMWDWDPSADDYAPWYGFQGEILKVNIKAGATSIGDYAFEFCTVLKSVRIPTSVKRIGEVAFGLCSSLKSVEIPEGVTSIGQAAFNCCYQLASITIPESLTEISMLMLGYCYDLKSITIPESVTTIGEYAFEHCDSLTSITIPAGVTSIGRQAFRRCRSLTEFRVDSSSASFCTQDGILYTIDKTELIACPTAKTGECIIPDGVTMIDDYSFDGCGGVTAVTIPGSVTYLGHAAFQACTGLTSVTVPGGIKEIEAFAFEDCVGLTSVTIMEGVTEIGQDAFTDCVGLTSVILPNSMASIGRYAFWGCTGLTSMTFPPSVTFVGELAFGGCTGLTSVTVLNQDCEFYDNYNLGDPDVVTVIGFKGSTAENYANTYGYKFEEAGPCAAGHDFGEWIRLQAPDCTKAGKEERTCSRCGETETQEVEALGHDYKDEVTAPTCTEKGYTTHTCSRCGDKYTDDEKDALGHDYKDGVCTRCGEADPDYKPGLENPFEDVRKGAFYYDAVLWAVNAKPQVTSGTSKTTFSPNNTCTRAQVVTFLWRASGCPEPSIDKAAAPFTDVSETSYYYKAVLWAVEKKITKGLTSTTFGPDQGCTRGQVVTFLHRFAGTPAPGGDENPFSDVKKGAFYYDAVLWAVEKNVTKGTTPTTFSPNDTCTRGQIVTFLYRAVTGG